MTEATDKTLRSDKVFSLSELCEILGIDEDKVKDRSLWMRSEAHTRAILDEVGKERSRQRTKWGLQEHEDGTGPDEIYEGFVGTNKEQADAARDRTQAGERAGRSETWADILEEEVREAYAESDEDALREELVQVAAVAVQWIEAIDARD